MVRDFTYFGSKNLGIMIITNLSCDTRIFSIGNKAIKTSVLNLTQIGSNRDLDPGQYATDASWVKLTQMLWSTFLTRNSGSIFNPE